MGELVSSDSPLGDLPRDASILIEGPPMTGKYALLLTILAHYSEDTIVISTKHDADRVMADFEGAAGGPRSGRLGVIDCVPRPSGVTTPASDLVEAVGSPENLTRIGVAFTEFFERFYDEASSPAVSVGFHSISQLLMHTGLQKTYQFLQVLIGQVRSVDWLFVAVVDTNIEEQELQTLYHHFDGLVETRENDQGSREFRVRGVAPTASEWWEF